MNSPTPGDLIPLTCNEIQRLLISVLSGPFTTRPTGSAEAFIGRWE